MLNKKSIDAVSKSNFGKTFKRPLYSSYCFSNIPKTIISLLNGDSEIALPLDSLPRLMGKKYQKVVFLFVDAFGWKFFEKYEDRYPSLQRFVKNGVVSKITSQFPSTTSVHVTSANTGLSVGESGVYEWFYYEPKLDAVIAPLLFSYARDEGRDTLKATGIDPKKLYPTQTVYNTLKEKGVKSYVFPQSDFTKSPYNLVMNEGVTYSLPFGTVAEGLTLLSDAVAKEKNKAYFFFYYGKVDTVGHEYGPESRAFESEIDVFFTALEKIFFKYIEDKSPDTLILLSADHGQTRVYPEKTIYLNKELPNIAEFFKTTKKGDPIVPAGSCRDMFLHVKEGRIMELKNKLKELLKGEAEVYETDFLIKEGFFGKKEPSDAFKSRVGNLVILPYRGEAVWWYEKDVFEQKHIGHHGGLTPEEMEIPLLALSI